MSRLLKIVIGIAMMVSAPIAYVMFLIHAKIIEPGMLIATGVIMFAGFLIYYRTK